MVSDLAAYLLVGTKHHNTGIDLAGPPISVNGEESPNLAERPDHFLGS